MVKNLSYFFTYIFSTFIAILTKLNQKVICTGAFHCCALCFSRMYEYFKMTLPISKMRIQESITSTWLKLYHISIGCMLYQIVKRMYKRLLWLAGSTRPRIHIPEKISLILLSPNGPLDSMHTFYWVHWISHPSKFDVKGMLERFNFLLPSSIWQPKFVRIFLLKRVDIYILSEETKRLH